MLREEALKIARNSHRFTIGIFYQDTREVYHKSLYGSLNPVKESLSRDKRSDKIIDFLKYKFTSLKSYLNPNLESFIVNAV